MLDSMVKYRDFQLKSAEVRALKTKYPEQTDEFEADANKWDERAQMVIEQISESVAQKVKNSLVDFDKNQSNELEKAVSNLVYLYAQGGSVDCPGPDDEEDDDQSDEVRKAIGEIRQDFKRIREMQGQLKIQHLPIADPDE
ncbi:MAG: hypothetical protein IH989_01775 [Planctomycetes bacterium]|nr:hypothetical protein [Planctomycetota bacterium]